MSMINSGTTRRRRSTDDARRAAVLSAVGAERSRGLAGGRRLQQGRPRSSASQTQGERSALSEERLTRAAVSLLIERGIAGMTLSALGKRAGCSRGLISHHFGSKAGLLLHVHDSVADAWLRRVQGAIGASTGAEALERLTDALVAFMRERPDELRAMYLLRYASIDPSAECRASVARANHAHIRALAVWINDGQERGEFVTNLDAELAAKLFAGAIDGVLYRWLVNPETPLAEVQALMRELPRLTLQGTALASASINPTHRRLPSPRALVERAIARLLESLRSAFPIAQLLRALERLQDTPLKRGTPFTAARHHVSS
jgi:AcrR family transcriptional regulator